MLEYAEWYYGPQKRIFSSIRADIKGNNRFYDKAILIGAFQRIDEDRIDQFAVVIEYRN